MVDGFHWTRVTSKQLRFLYEEIVQSPLPDTIREQAARAERSLSAGKEHATPCREDADVALRNPGSRPDV
jgi:hypothetical protein